MEYIQWIREAIQVTIKVCRQMMAVLFVSAHRLICGYCLVLSQAKGGQVKAGDYIVFPFDFNSSIEIGAGEPLRAKGCQDRFLANLERELTKRKARSVSVQGHRLEFTGTSFFVSNLNMLAPISGGSVEIRADEGSVFIQYRLSFEFLFWITLAGAGLIGIPALSTSGTDGLLFLLLIWLWLFFGNFTLTIFRFSRLLGKLAGSTRP